MSVTRLVMLVTVSMTMTGCASMRSRQELARLQSQVGLLEERVTQMERVGLSGGFPPAANELATESPAAMEPITQPQRLPEASGKVSVKSALVKPSTRQIQRALKNAGFYEGEVDGKMGPKTREAIKEFQRVHGLSDDGVVGKQTWAKLRAYAELSAGGGEVNAAEPK